MPEFGVCCTHTAEVGEVGTHCSGADPAAAKERLPSVAVRPPDVEDVVCDAVSVKLPSVWLSAPEIAIAPLALDVSASSVLARAPDTATLPVADEVSVPSVCVREPTGPSAIVPVAATVSASSVLLRLPAMATAPDADDVNALSDWLRLPAIATAPAADDVNAPSDWFRLPLIDPPPPPGVYSEPKRNVSPCSSFDAGGEAAGNSPSSIAVWAVNTDHTP